MSNAIEVLCLEGRAWKVGEGIDVRLLNFGIFPGRITELNADGTIHVDVQLPESILVLEKPLCIGEGRAFIPCEICRNPATCWVQDILEKIPIFGVAWKHREPFGEPHFFCEEHRRESQTVYEGDHIPLPY